MYDVVALGELLIDFTPHGQSERGHSLFETNAGGAPANVLAVLAKLGKKTSFIGKVGKDPFGSFLENTLKEIGIDTSGLVVSADVNTTLAFVHLNAQGERSFHFYRSPGADMMLKEEELSLDFIKEARIFHFGSLSMTHEPAKSATLKALQTAKEHGILVSYDPNLRPALWPSLQQAKKTILAGMAYADVLKISEEEMEFLTGTADLEEGSAWLFDRYPLLKMALITLGSKGCFYRIGEQESKDGNASARVQMGLVGGFEVEAVDTTGAGDAFFGAFLSQVLEVQGSQGMLGVERMIRFANAAGALATTKKGAIPAMPSRAEVEDLISGG